MSLILLSLTSLCGARQNLSELTPSRHQSLLSLSTPDSLSEALSCLTHLDISNHAGFCEPKISVSCSVKYVKAHFDNREQQSPQPLSCPHPVSGHLLFPWAEKNECKHKQCCKLFLLKLHLSRISWKKKSHAAFVFGSQQGTEIPHKQIHVMNLLMCHHCVSQIRDYKKEGNLSETKIFSF